MTYAHANHQPSGDSRPMVMIMKYIWRPTVLASKYTYMSPNGRSIKSNKIFNNPNGNKTFVVCNGSDYKTIYKGGGTRQQQLHFFDFDFFEDSSECFHMLPPTKYHFSINYFVVFREMLKNLETVVWILVQDCSNSTVAKELPWRLWSYCSLALSILWAHVQNFSLKFSP